MKFCNCINTEFHSLSVGVYIHIFVQRFLCVYRQFSYFGKLLSGHVDAHSVI